MSKGGFNNRQKDISRVLRQQSVRRGYGGKAFAARTTKVMAPAGKGR